MWKGILTAILLLFSTVNGVGHPMPHSIFILDVKGGNIYAELKMPLKELQFVIPFDVTEQTENLLEDERRNQLSDYFLIHIRPKSLNGLDWKVEILDMLLEETEQESTGKYKELTLHLSMQPPSGESVRNFKLYYDAILHQVVTHKIFVNLRLDWQSGRIDDKELSLGLIELSIADNNIKPMQINLEEGSRWKGFVAMVCLGIGHIAEGIDHLLFLLVLLLPVTLKAEYGHWATFAGTRKSVWSIFKIVTAFTVGHSFSLLLGAKQWVILPQQPVEIVIAITIFITAIHALRPIFPNKEVIVAIMFGLIHGLAFSTVISEMNLDTNELSYSILGYNIGIELMQIFVLVLTIPWIVILSKNNHFRWIRIIGAILAIIISVAWMTERYTMKSNIVSSTIETASNQGKWLVLMLFLFAMVSAFRVRSERERRYPSNNEHDDHIG